MSVNNELAVLGGKKVQIAKEGNLFTWPISVRAEPPTGYLNVEIRELT